MKQKITNETKNNTTTQKSLVIKNAINLDILL